MPTMANPLVGALPVEDPFVSSQPTDSQRSRYSGFDNQTFSLYAGGSPSQAKRALEAYLSETQRRLTEASHLGVVLVKQRQDLEERLRDVENQNSGEEIGPDLRQKLSELEREVNDISRETARIFVPKSRVPSGETADASVLSSQAQNSPSKVQAPSRKQRNQPQTRMNDVKLATEISTSLLNQIRELQAGYAEKDDALRLVSAQKSELEVDLDALRQRLRALDESEQRFKDENWSLETQVHDLTAIQREATEREQKLGQSLNTAKSEKSSLEREFEELKLTHGKLSEDHAATRKLHESEMVNLRRNATINETELNTLNKKVEELTSQNKELARAVTYRLQTDRAVSQDMSFTDGGEEEDQVTPDNSPPPSPSKATPRHGGLESETLKSSLHHAHRMIQNLKNNIHREKTEKYELKRLLQEARDDLESKRGGVDSGKKKNQKEKDALKKPGRIDRLGAARSAKDEVILDDPDWEDHSPTGTPSKAPVNRSEAANSDVYVTATENSDAFETANEHEASNTETDAFQTGVETLDGNSESDDLTETESAAGRNIAIRKRPSNLNRYSMHSTASTSDDDADDFSVQTPVQPQHPKYKLRMNRGNYQKSSAKSPVFIDSPALQDSPIASVASSSGTPVQGQSLFAELGNLSDVETEESNTPQSNGFRSQFNTPDINKKATLPSKLRAVQTGTERSEMVDSSTMTEETKTESKANPSAVISAVGGALVGGMAGAGLGQVGSHAENEIPATMETEVKSTVLDFTPILSQSTEPSEFKAPVLAAPSLQNTAIISQHTEPSEGKALAVAPLAFANTSIISQHTEPLEAEAILPAPLALQNSSIISQHTEPSESNATAPVLLTLENSAIVSQHTEPIVAPKHVADFNYSSVVSQHSEPIAPSSPKQQAIVVPDIPVVKSMPLEYSTVMAQETVPQSAVAPSTSSIAVQAGLKEVNDTDSQTTANAKSAFGIFGAVFGRNKSEKSEPITVAEDATSGVQEQTSSKDVGSEARVPFQIVDGNAQTTRNIAEKPTVPGSKASDFSSTNESTQTMLSAKDIDNLFKVKPADTTASSVPSLVNVSPRKSRDPKRPGSSGSNRSGISPPPPLPAEAKQVIAAAAQRSSVQSSVSGQQQPVIGTMGPPTMPASAYRASQSHRPRTPLTSSALPSPILKGAGKGPQSINRSGLSSPATTRRSSVSSFASELDQRFNIGRNTSHAQGFDPNSTDPRMIQAITQTMIGDYMFKYTRKAGREDFSSSRHRRFFWVHPYTRTLYWSEQDPASAGRTELKAKSVAIEAVRVVTDENPSPPGLHRKSIVIITPGRTIKMTAETSQHHETWFNALSYLLLKTGPEQEDENGITSEDVDEFNPGGFRSNSRATGRSRASVSSYASRHTARSDRDYPTLRPNQYRSQSVQPQSISHRISTMFRPQSIQGSQSGRYSRQSAHQSSLHATSDAHDSAEDLRKVIQAGESEGHRLENVRACCDGKHDVGSLSTSTRTGRTSTQPVSFSLSSRHSRNRSSSRHSQTRQQQRHLEMDPANIT